MLRLAQTGAGRLLISLLFGAGFLALYQLQPEDARNSGIQLLLAALLCSVAGSRRPQALLFTTTLLFFLAPEWFPSRWLARQAAQAGISQTDAQYLQYASLALVLTGSAVLMGLTRKFPSHRLARWPVVSLLAAYFGLVGLAFSGYFSAWGELVLFSLIWAWSAYLWPLVYALRDLRSSQAESSLSFQMATFHPFFSGSWIMIGLGAANLRQRMARNARQLAVCQLKAVKLLAACGFMLALQRALSALRGWGGIPEFTDVLHAHLRGEPSPARWVCWLCLFCWFFEQLAASFALGNLLVALARLGGFQLLQQVYKPWSARSQMDYWRRISYYYSQVIVEVFFFPTFVGYFKSQPRLRQVFALFMAVVVGNFVYHFRNLLGTFARLGLLATLEGLQSYACYCGLLFIGLLISQISTDAQPRPSRGWGRFWLLLRIFFFFSALSLFDEIYSPYPLIRRITLGTYLLGF